MNDRLMMQLKSNKIHQYFVYWCKDNVQINGDGRFKDAKDKKMRPCLVLSKDIANATANIVTVAPLTTVNSKTKIPQHVKVKSVKNGVALALVEQIMTIPKTHLLPKPIYRLDDKEVMSIKVAITDLLLGREDLHKKK